MAEQDIAALKALAQAATPGPWAAVHWTCHAATTVKSADGAVAVAETTGFGRDSDECATDAAFIAAANPAAVLELIAALEAMRKDAARYLFDLRNAYDQYCDMCPQHGITAMPFDKYKARADEMNDEAAAASARVQTN